MKMDINHKLNLIQELRREQNRRERDIYKNYNRNIREDVSIQEEYGTSIFSSFRLRLLTAIFLFLCFFIMDKNDVSVGNIGKQQILKCISEYTITDDFFIIVDKQ